jgi:hypothetical protein
MVFLFLFPFSKRIAISFVADFRIILYIPLALCELIIGFLRRAGRRTLFSRGTELEAKKFQ